MEHLINLYKIESSIIFNNISNNDIINFWKLVKQTYDTNNTIFIAGNGGNAGYAANMHTDFLIHPFVNENKTEKVNLKRLKCINLCDSSSTITGIGNDIGFENIFLEQLEAMFNPSDLFIGISGSGTSKNIVRCLDFCKKNSMNHIMITKNPIIEYNTIVIRGTSEFPGQTGKNMANFHFEDCISKITHIITGILKDYVQPITK